MYFTQNLSSGYLIPLFFILTAGIFIILYIMRIIIPMIFPWKINTDSFRKYFAALEGIVWGVFLISSALFFIKHNFIFSLFLFLIILILCYWYFRFALRDYIAGLIFKFENRFSLNEVIEVAEMKGEIKNFYNRSIEIETESGNRIYLPYSMLLDVISSPQKVSETVLNFSFEISIPTAHQYEKVVDQLKKYIYSLPWSVLKNEPKINLIDETEDRYILRITLFSFDESYFQSMRKQIELFVSQNFKG